MEGHRKLPDAIHNFPPGNPDLWKGSPYVKSLSKGMATCIVGFATIVAVNAFLNRNEKGPLGFEVNYSEDEIRKRVSVGGIFTKFANLGLPVYMQGNKTPFDDNMRFDDGVEFVGATMDFKERRGFSD